MTTLYTLFFGLLLAVCTTAQKDAARASSTSGSRVFQPWLLGLTAVVVFLFIVFSLMIINRLFCKKKKDEDEDEKIERTTMNVYDNDGLDEESATEKQIEMEDTKKAKWENENNEQKITPM
ncbi:PREDICTED: small integral membrane protein 24 [Nanorana parkeri]|uniref:small integral membrane protein 24 n=1 Tax=Nanorana parkeri TaxID=125878 RepID=UPI0008541E48|nr:PREDICTED: small integral membrane protein 24 [Nanorana parkeri]